MIDESIMMSPDVSVAIQAVSRESRGMPLFDPDPLQEIVRAKAAALPKSNYSKAEIVSMSA